MRKASGLCRYAELRARAAEFGREIKRRFGAPLAQTHGAGDTLELPLDGPRVVDHVMLMEEIVCFERVHWRDNLQRFVPSAADTSKPRRRTRQSPDKQSLSRPSESLPERDY